MWTLRARLGRHYFCHAAVGEAALQPAHRVPMTAKGGRQFTLCRDASVGQQRESGRFRGPVLDIIDVDGRGAKEDSALSVAFQNLETPAEQDAE